MKNAVQIERERCVAICRRRASLWRATGERSPIASAREEARARANEAAYLADLLESGADLSEMSVVDGDDADA